MRRDAKVAQQAGEVQVRCPWRLGAITRARIGPSGAVCIACGNTGHEVAERAR